MDRQDDPQPGDRGFALLVVILAAGVLALIVAGFSLSVRTEMRAASVAVENAKAEALADAGVQLAILSLIAARTQRSAAWQVPGDGRPTFCTIRGGLLRISIEDEAGKIDLNAAGERLLRSVLMGAGFGDSDAAARADAIIDYRDPDDQRRTHGAESADYRDGGRPAGPKNAPFARVEELVQVPGFEAAAVIRLRPFVSVHSGRPGLDYSVASRALTAILTEGYARLAASGGTAQQQLGQGGNRLPVEFSISTPRRVYAIRAEARTTGGSVFVREAVIELSRTRAGIGHVVREWRRGTGISADFSAPAAAIAPAPC
ncbi:MAG: general secretion pathway protein GspK [Hyphomicrobiaceae bacterium]|nr:general secretion pathway protein GspK [Hyphomicrobiaceae bacterium]